MTVNVGIKVRIKPNAEQRRLLNIHFGANRFIWNYFLEKRNREYQESKKGSTYVKDCLHLTLLKHDGEHDWLNQVSVASLQRTLKHLDTTFRAFFNRHANFPRFKSKKRGIKSFTLAGKNTIRGKRISFPMFQKGIRFNRSLPSFSKINNVTIKLAPSGKYYAYLSVECDKEYLPKHGIEVGVDLGLTDFSVFSDGTRISAQKLTQHNAAKLKRAQQHLSRKKKGSIRRGKQKNKVAKVYEKITNSRKNFIHQTSSTAINKYDVIYLESLSVENMAKNKSLASSIYDVSWGEFLRQLQYKSSWYGKEIRKIGRWYPSSKTCGSCGFIHQDLRLADRKWKCPRCKVVLDRDLNAALNILAEGRRSFGAAISENKRGEGVRPKRLSAEASFVEPLNSVVDDRIIA